MLIWPWTLIIKVDQCSYGSCVKRWAIWALLQSRYIHFSAQKIKKLDFHEFFEVKSSFLWGSLETYSDPLYACKSSISYLYRWPNGTWVCRHNLGGIQFLSFVAFYTGLFTPRGAKKHAGQNTDYLAELLRA